MHTIRESIESVLAQDYPHIEYIVVDGASTDGTLDILDGYRDQIATIVSERDRGMYEAINKGIRLATGDIVGLMHSDDAFYDRRVVSRIVDAFLQHDPEMLYGNGVFVDAQNPERIVRNWISGKRVIVVSKRDGYPSIPLLTSGMKCLGVTVCIMKPIA